MYPDIEYKTQREVRAMTIFIKGGVPQRVDLPDNASIIHANVSYRTSCIFEAAIYNREAEGVRAVSTVVHDLAEATTSEDALGVLVQDASFGEFHIWANEDIDKLKCVAGKDPYIDIACTGAGGVKLNLTYVV